MNTNNQNPGVGKAFELVVIKWFEDEYKMEFVHNASFYIGDPPKAHCFDVSSGDKKIVAECKCYTWTETGNIPSAKMGFVNEAVFYLSFITTDTYVVLKKSQHPKRTETLAEYYFKTNRHLLGCTRVLEFDVEQKTMREIR